jgi:predicted Zn-dependent protease
MIDFRAAVRRRDILLLAAVAALLTVACATVPLTGRSQLTLISRPTLLQMSAQTYRDVLETSTLSTDRGQNRRVRRVGIRVADAAEALLLDEGLPGQADQYDWTFKVIDEDDTMNAWCLPGGQIAVYTGLLPVTRDDAGLSVVLAHEVAHAVAHHGAERLSQGLLVQMGGIALSVALAEQPRHTQTLFMTAYGLGATVGYILPYSRTHEFEADRIGLTIMARAGYDPAAAVGLWMRMIEASEDKPRPPAFLSTHPAPPERIEQIERFIPEARRYYRRAT